MESVGGQTHENYIHIVVDDASTDGTHEEIVKYATDKTIIYRNEKNVTWVPNAVKYIDRHVEDEDVIVFLDLDDWFSESKALAITARNYRKRGLWACYSQHIRITSLADGARQKLWGKPYPQEVKQKRSYRHFKLLFMHMRSFKGFLWKAINKDDLKGPDGEYANVTYDYAVFFPALEMTPPEKVGFIKRPLVVYNLENPLNDRRIRKPAQKDMGEWFKQKDEYPLLKR